MNGASPKVSEASKAIRRFFLTGVVLLRVVYPYLEEVDLRLKGAISCCQNVGA
jgi:hypothetical protein